jgi:Mannosyl-glycoprotein endo-beta-N-acetylglucosaminidase
MPTWKGMFIARRAPVTLCVVLALLIAPAAAGAVATSTTSTVAGSTRPAGSTAPGSTTTTTKPPAPDTFSLPSDFGYQLLEQQVTAKNDLAAAKKALPDAQRRSTVAERDDKAAKEQLKKLRASAKKTQQKLEVTRQHLKLAAARAYMHADGGELMAAITSVTDANSAVDIASRIHIITTYGQGENEALDEYLDLKSRLDRQVSEITDMQDRTARELKTAQEHLVTVQHAIKDANARLEATVKGIEEFRKAATSASSPILGPSFLSANQMADYVTHSGAKPRITVPLIDLAQMYLDEGAKTGVRGDVAFAQSILETGGFANPGSAATDNNFAGIGWCDSCKHGFNFPDAQTGVRAQLQLLRIYVDPKFPDPSYKEEILLKGTLKLGFRGKVQTWWDLWGTWATAAMYGQRVYDLYQRIVFFAATDPALPAKKLDTPPPSGKADDVTRPGDSGAGTKKP